MKTWMVLKVLNVVMAVIGPLPYDLAECKDRSVMFNFVLDETFKDAKKVSELRTTWPDIKREDVGYVCVERENRPVIKTEEM